MGCLFDSYHHSHTAKCVHGKTKCKVLQVVNGKQNFSWNVRGLDIKSHLHAERLAQEGRLHALPLNAESGKAAERLVLLIISDEVLRMRIGTNSAATVN